MVQLRLTCLTPTPTSSIINYRVALPPCHPATLPIDEIDALIGDTLIAVLRQLRAGYAKRPRLFPQSVVLCSVRNVHDCRIHCTRNQEIITGGNAFNIKACSLRMDNFDKAKVQSLYRQHTADPASPSTPRRWS